MIQNLISLFALYLVFDFLKEQIGAFWTIVLVAASFYFLGTDGTLYAALSLLVLYVSYEVLSATIPPLFYGAVGCYAVARTLVRM